MGIAKLYNQKQSGIDINGIIQDYYVYAGENVSAGDFVEFINGVAGQTTSTSVDTEIRAGTYTGKVISAVKLDNNRVFIAHGVGTDCVLYGIVVTINETTITAGTDIQLASATESGSYLTSQLLSNGKVLVLHCYDTSFYHLSGIVVTISGTTITAGTDTTIVGTNRSGYTDISTQLLPNGNIFIAHNYSTNYRLYGIVVTINGTTITAGTDTAISTNNYTGQQHSLQLLPNGNIFIAHSYLSDYYLYGTVVTISGTTITPKKITALVSALRAGVKISTQLLPNGNIFIAHSYSTYYHLYGIVVTVNGTTITPGTDTQISGVNKSGWVISTQILSNTKVFIAHSYDSDYYLYGVVVTINETTITNGTDTQLSSVIYSGFAISTQLLTDGNIFIAHCYGSNYHLYAQLFGIDEANNIPTNNVTIAEYETQVRKTTTSQFDGVAKTSGIGGDETAHEDLVSIYTL